MEHCVARTCCSLQHPVARCLGLYKIGQYAFFSFPQVSSRSLLLFMARLLTCVWSLLCRQISCFEWHPFTISSGPDETTAEIHVYAQSPLLTARPAELCVCSDDAQSRAWQPHKEDHGARQSQRSERWFASFRVLLVALLLHCATLHGDGRRQASSAVDPRRRCALQS